jgi:hypothetical protein
MFDPHLVGETSFHEKAGRSQGNSGFIVSSWFFSLTKFFSRRVATVAMLPSALSRSEESFEAGSELGPRRARAASAEE